MRNDEVGCVHVDGREQLAIAGMITGLSTGRGKVTAETVLTVKVFDYAEPIELPLTALRHLERSYHDFHIRERSYGNEFWLKSADLMGRRVAVIDELTEPLFVFENDYDRCVQESRENPTFKAVDTYDSEYWSEDLGELVRSHEPDTPIVRQFHAAGQYPTRYFKREYDQPWEPIDINYDIIYEKAG